MLYILFLLEGRELCMKYNLRKPKKYNLINQELINIINNSRFYTSSFDNPFLKGVKLDELNYRCTDIQKENWIEGIINNDPRIIKVKAKKNFVVIVCRNHFDNKSERYVIFVNEKKWEGDLNATQDKTKTKKIRLHNVQNKPRPKKRGRKKVTRK
jgi:hypothetical protein